MGSAVLSLTNWTDLIECLHLVHIDSNHQAVIQQHVMAGKMVVWEIDAPLEHIRVHYAGFAFVLAGDNLHAVTSAESVVETHGF